MSEGLKSGYPAHAGNRRHFITGLAMGLGALAVSARAGAVVQQPAMNDVPGTAANRTKTSLHYEADVKTTPEGLYHALLDPKQFAAFTSLPAEIDAKEGGAFSLFGGLIVGRNVELIPSQRIVQAWRPSHWDAGIYSIVRFELKPSGAQTKMILDHTGFPEGLADHLDEGWRGHYLDGLKKYFI
jgi:activator of HSP90 ATPase